MSDRRPSRLMADMWTGTDSPPGDIEESRWGLRPAPRIEDKFLAPAVVDKREWRHPKVGWGVVLPDREGASDADLATADDAPEAIRKLVAARDNAPVLRYRPDLEGGYLRRYYAHRDHQDMAIQSPSGVDEGQMPLYLLIVGSPESIPWSLQFALNMSRYVGRLDLDDHGFDNYVNALLTDWDGQQSDTGAPLLWNVDHGGADITHLMAFAIGEQLWQKFSIDVDAPRVRRLVGPEATGAGLSEALSDLNPAFVATTSHGMTGPLGQAAQLKATLGFPVDADYAPVGPDALTAHWSPRGAMWYSHACCSAGSDASSRYADLFPEQDPLTLLLEGVCNDAKAITAPLPRALLGADQPLRAFVGHVEPTFDWTLRDPSNQQPMSHQIVAALYDQLFRRDRSTPLGYALNGVYSEAGKFFADWAAALSAVDDNLPGARDTALYRKLVATDRQGIVLLGDPTVSLAF